MNYLLRQNIDMVCFLKKVDSCSDTVLLETGEGDILNLKSQLTKFIFLSAALDYSNLKNYSISCTPEDALILSDYLIL